MQLKGLYPKTIGKLARRTVNKILHEDLGYTSGKSVMAQKPQLTKEKNAKRKQWASERRTRIRSGASICSVIRRYGGQGQKLEGGYIGVCLGLIDLTLPTLSVTTTIQRS